MNRKEKIELLKEVQKGNYSVLFNSHKRINIVWFENGLFKEMNLNKDQPDKSYTPEEFEEYQKKYPKSIFIEIIDSTIPRI